MDSSNPGFDWKPATNVTVSNDPYYYQMSAYQSPYTMLDQHGNPLMYNYPFLPCSDGQLGQPLPPLISDDWQLLPPDGRLVTNQPPVTRTPRPQGCKTLFIGNLPKQALDDIVAAKILLREIFGRIDTISEIRVNARGFAHVRFINEDAVDRAVWFNGSKLIIGKTGSKDCTSVIHLDYSENSKDLDEVIRHRVEEMHRSQSPEKIIPFSTFEANLLLEKMKSDKDMAHCVDTLFGWLDRGEVNRRSVTPIYTMIQSAYSHVKRLQNDQEQHYQAYISAKNHYLCRIQEILKLMDQIKRIFEAASKQKCWDHFTKAQRKNLASWKNSVQEAIEREKNTCMNWRTEEEMEMSDSDMEDSDSTVEPPPPKIERLSVNNDAQSLQRTIDQLEMEKIQHLESIGHLTQENESLKSTISELKAANASQQESDSPDKESQSEEIQLLKQRIIVLEASLKSEKSLRAAKENEMRDLEARTLSETRPSTPPTEANLPASSSVISGAASQLLGKKELESEILVKCIGVIISFLLLHPLGASTDYIWSYLSQLGYKIRPREIEELLESLPSCFKLVINGVGAKIDKKWHLVGIQACPSSET